MIKAKDLIMMLVIVIVGWFVLVSCGCTTSATTGHKKLFGIVKVPFTAPDCHVEPSAEAMAFEQLAPFQYVALSLIVAGVFWWWTTKGSTGLGKVSVALGAGLSTFAVVMPQIAGYVGLIAIVAVIGVVAYLVWDKLLKKQP